MWSPLTISCSGSGRPSGVPSGTILLYRQRDYKSRADGVKGAINRRFLAVAGELAVRAIGFGTRLGILRPLPGTHQLGELAGRQRRAEMESLVLIAAEGAQELELLGGLDPLGDHFELQAVRQGDDGLDDGGIYLALEIPDEGAVDLQLVDREAAQIVDARVAGAEVIDRHQHAHAAQLLEDRRRLLRIGHHRALGELDLEEPRLEPGALQGTAHHLEQIAPPEL